MSYRTVVVGSKCQRFIKPENKECISPIPDLQADVVDFTIHSKETKKVIVCYKYPFDEPGKLVVNLWTRGTTPEQDENVLAQVDVANNNGFSINVTNLNTIKIYCSLNYQASI
jgi:hypothetical protein